MGGAYNWVKSVGARKRARAADGRGEGGGKESERERDWRRKQTDWISEERGRDALTHVPPSSTYENYVNFSGHFSIRCALFSLPVHVRMVYNRLKYHRA